MPAHDRSISIAKAICIILMVAGHCECPDNIERWIYLFHMPAFFFISGFLLSEKYLTGGWTGYLRFIWQKIKGLYLPYVIFSLLFLALTNLFCSWNLIDYRLSSQEFWHRTFQILTLRGHQQLLNGYWFLKTLFLSSIISVLCLRLVKSFKFRCILILLFLSLAAACGLIDADTTMISRMFSASAFYITGYLFKNHPIKVNIWQSLTGFTALAGISIIFACNIFAEGWTVFAMYPIGIIGTLSATGVSNLLINSKLSNTLDTIGSHTLSILTFHFISFKLISLLKIWIYNLPISSLAEYQVVHAHHEWYWWLLYTFVGVALPTLIGILWKEAKTFSRSSSKIG